MVSPGPAWVSAKPSVLQGLCLQLPRSVPPVATLRTWCPCAHDALADALASGNSAPVPAAKTTAGSHTKALRPVRAPTFPAPVI